MPKLLNNRIYRTYRTGAFYKTTKETEALKLGTPERMSKNIPIALSRERLVERLTPPRYYEDDPTGRVAIQ